MKKFILATTILGTLFMTSFVNAQKAPSAAPKQAKEKANMVKPAANKEEAKPVATKEKKAPKKAKVTKPASEKK